MTSSAWLPLLSEGGVSEGRGGRINEVLSISLHDALPIYEVLSILLYMIYLCIYLPPPPLSGENNLLEGGE